MKLFGYIDDGLNWWTDFWMGLISPLHIGLQIIIGFISLFIIIMGFFWIYNTYFHYTSPL